MKGELNMNFSQRLGLFILIAITVSYIYFSFFSDKNFEFPEVNNKQEETHSFNPFEKPTEVKQNEPKANKTEKNVKIFILDKTGKLRAVNRTCDTRRCN